MPAHNRGGGIAHSVNQGTARDAPEHDGERGAPEGLQGGEGGGGGDVVYTVGRASLCTHLGSATS